MFFYCDCRFDVESVLAVLYFKTFGKFKKTAFKNVKGTRMIKRKKTFYLYCDCRFDIESVLTAFLHVTLRLQDVRPGLPQRRRSRPWQPCLAVLRRNAGRLWWATDLAVPSEGDLVPAGPARHPQTPGGRVQARSDQLQLPASDESDERGVRVSAVRGA